MHKNKFLGMDRRRCPRIISLEYKKRQNKVYNSAKNRGNGIQDLILWNEKETLSKN